MADSLGYSIFLDPVDTVRAWEARGQLQPTVRWSEMMHEQHAVAFTVAKIAKLDVLRQVQASLDGMIRNGMIPIWKLMSVSALIAPVMAAMMNRFQRLVGASTGFIRTAMNDPQQDTSHAD